MGQLIDDTSELLWQHAEWSSSITSLLPYLTQGLRITIGFHYLMLPEWNYLETGQPQTCSLAGLTGRRALRGRALWYPWRRWRPVGTWLHSYKCKRFKCLACSLHSRISVGPAKLYSPEHGFYLGGFWSHLFVHDNESLPEPTDEGIAFLMSQLPLFQ